MESFYFTYWISKYGKEQFKKLTSKVCSKISVPSKVKNEFWTDEYLFQYFYVVYYTITLNYFGLNRKQISFLLDLSLTPGTCKIFSPSEILKVHKDVIPEIEEYVKCDFISYNNLKQEE